MERDSIFKTALVLGVFISFSLTGLAVENYDGPTDQPHIMDQPDEPNTTGPNATFPDLPGNASDTARQLIDTVRNAFENAFQGVGDALRNLFQNNGSG